MLKSLGQEMKSRIPVLVLTAKDQLEHKLHGFPTGADDYVVKPVALAELEMRLRVLVQRTHSAMAEPQALRNSAKQGGGQGLGLFLTKGGVRALRVDADDVGQSLARHAGRK